MIRNLIIGIDTGVNTGIAISHTHKGLLEVKSMKILDAMEMVLDHKENIISVIVEDARFVKFKVKRERAQGAGSVKRDAQIWEDFLEKHSIPYKMVRPNKRITKWEARRFAEYTGWTKKTNDHSRDAGMLSFHWAKIFNEYRRI